MATYNIKITDDRQVLIPRGISWGCMKENKATSILFELPETINGTPTDDFNKSIDFECMASGYKFSKELNNCECEICENTTNFKNLKAQVVLTKLIDAETNEHIVWKSEIFNISFDESINATEKIKIII